MVKKVNLTLILAVVGTVLAWFPILAPVVLSGIVFAGERIFRFDYLMPAEFFPVALSGGCLLIWAALRARLREKIIHWGFGIAVCALIASQSLALVTGLASGELAAGGWWWVVVLALLATHSLALVAIGVGGLLLLRDLFEMPRSTGWKR